LVDQEDISAVAFAQETEAWIFEAIGITWWPQDPETKKSQRTSPTFWGLRVDTTSIQKIVGGLHKVAMDIWG